MGYNWFDDSRAKLLADTEVEANKLADYQKLLPWYAALANRKSKRANVVMLGDSLTEGYPMSSFDRSTPAQLAQILRARHPTTGVTGGRGFIGMPTSFFTTGNPGVWPTTATGGSFDDAVYAVGGKHRCWLSNVIGNKVVFSLASSITSFDINHMKNSAGAVATGYYKIDGGTAVTFGTNNASNTSSITHVASAATTSIEVGINDAHFMFLEGITEYNGDENAGITVHNCGQSSYTTTAWLVNSTGTANGWPKSIKNLAPDLLIIQLGMNDGNSGAGNLSAAQFQTNMTALIAILRAATVTCPIVLSMVWGTSLAYVNPWSSYVAAAQNIANNDSTVIVVDHSVRMPAGNAANTYSLYHTDNAHGNATGAAYTLVAETLYRAIAPK